jgi:hypothetical protein
MTNYYAILISISASCLTDATRIWVYAATTEIKDNTLGNLRGVPLTRVTITARQWTIHEEYNSKTRANDIAVVQMSVSFPKNEYTATAFLYFQLELLEPGKCGTRYLACSETAFIYEYFCSGNIQLENIKLAAYYLKSV